MEIGIIIFVITLVIDLYTDLWRWRHKMTINHTRGVLLRAIGLIPSIYLLSSPIGWTTVAMLFLVGFVYWFLFDGLFNLLRGYKWWSTGTDDPDDAQTDNFLQSLTLWQHIGVKIGGIVFFTILYILYKNI